MIREDVVDFWWMIYSLKSGMCLDRSQSTFFEHNSQGFWPSKDSSEVHETLGMGTSVGIQAMAFAWAFRQRWVRLGVKSETWTLCVGKIHRLLRGWSILIHIAIRSSSIRLVGWLICESNFPRNESIARVCSSKFQKSWNRWTWVRNHQLLVFFLGISWHMDPWNSRPSDIKPLPQVHRSPGTRWTRSCFEGKKKGKRSLETCSKSGTTLHVSFCFLSFLRFRLMLD